MDVLSDALRVVRLSGAVFFTARLSSPWSIQSPPASDLVSLLRLPSDCVTLFHVLVEGHCLVALEGHQTVELEAGDVVILPRGAGHVMGSDPQTTPKPMSALLPPLTSERIPDIVAGGRGEVTRFICGYLYCDQQFNPLMGTLPEVLVVSNHKRNECGQTRGDWAGPGVRAAIIQSGEWLETTLRYTVEEANGAGPGSALMLARLAEILFVEVLRRYMKELPRTERGWLAGVKDPVVGKALQLLHASPERTWTVEELARAIAVSRSTLADRFTGLIGEPPMRYLTRWRIQVAEHLLRQTNLSIFAVAERVGYASEAAFSRAFRRYVGRPPAWWRLSQV
jgi:AraC-like DNA-binding protein